ncbi:MAG: ABC transporter ATP-binding protein [Deltaproteobacteria bacterium]|nr:ABC transporter ATP-binding protein [Deltaproteobacteria bacterium]
MSNSPVIEIAGLRKSFRMPKKLGRSVEVLRGLDLTVNAGEVFGFLGPNGAGKSTTIKILTTLLRPSAGTVKILGEDPTHRTARQRLGYLPESPSLYDYLTGPELLRYYGALLGLDRHEAQKRADALFDRLGLPEKARNLQLRRYSKGMTQRIGLAQSLMGDPDLVILDEPVSGLDPVGRRDIRDLMFELRDQGKTVFFSTHIIPDVELVCDRVGIILDGKIVAQGAVPELIGDRLRETVVVVRGLDEASLPADLSPEIQRRSVTERVVLTVPADQAVDELLGKLLQAGASIESVQPVRAGLEDVFFEQVNDAGVTSPSSEEAAA